MLTTIQELEREIEQFRANIKESNELMNILMSLTALTKTQTETFETRTRTLYDDLAKLPPELSDVVQKKIADFVQTVHNEQQAYQATVTQTMDGYAAKIAKAEGLISETPGILDAQLKKDREESIAELKKVQEQFAAELSKANTTFAEQLNGVILNIQNLSSKIEDTTAAQYAAFLKELEKTIETRLEKLTQTEDRVFELGQQLESKYNAFVEKLESTNMDQLYKYCQDMNKAINVKLGLLLGGVAIAVIVSIVSLFI